MLKVIKYRMLWENKGGPNPFLENIEHERNGGMNQGGISKGSII